MFHSQGLDANKVFIFKMSEVRHGFGVDLVKQMQHSRDIEDAWIMFDQFKHVKN
jgi:hypothetical protein